MTIYEQVINMVKEQMPDDCDMVGLMNPVTFEELINKSANSVINGKLEFFKCASVKKNYIVVIADTKSGKNPNPDFGKWHVMELPLK